MIDPGRWYAVQGQVHSREAPETRTIVIKRREVAAMDIGRLMEERAPIDRAVREAQALTVKRHRQMDLPLVVWRDGRVQWIKADAVRFADERPEGGPR